ncbi:MAG: hypothetical protein KKG47_04985 [Proteobacteria bacterium]|nr:hypothetical protein [Pseudomonadota bacterium]MBU1739702.1 hypothetical protein [Pseudomonadota bacterium]
MKINVDRNVVEFLPGNPQETADLELLWRVIVDCMKENKKLVPIGEYIPVKENLARFTIEGVPGGKTTWTEHTSDADCTYYCSTCNKYMNVKAGENIPLCCGREMEVMD